VKYRVEVPNSFAVLEDFDTEVEINNISQEVLGYYEMKQHKVCFNEGCSKLLDQRKHAKLQW
jgi:hypothetical protein